MPVNETTLESFLDGNISILDELIGTEASQLTSLLSTGAISGMEASEILNQVTVAASPAAQRALINTRLNTYSRVATNTMMKDAPKDTKYVYVGPIDDRTRDECLEYSSEGALTEAQIMDNGWAASLVDGGGINCRHKWEIASDEGIKLFEGKKAQQVVKNKQGLTKNVVKSDGTITLKNFSVAEKEIESYWNPDKLQSAYKINDTGSGAYLNMYSGSHYKTFNEVGRYYNNDIKLGNMMSIRTTTGFRYVELKGVEQWKAAFNELNSLLTKAPNYSGRTYRGLGWQNTDKFEGFIKRFKKGNVVKNNGFWSSSASQSKATAFIPESSRYKVHLEIRGKTGTILNGMSKHIGEKEVLFSRNSNFIVKEIKEIIDPLGFSEKSYQIILEEV